jgi:hypothetical protein
MTLTLPPLALVMPILGACHRVDAPDDTSPTDSGEPAPLWPEGGCVEDDGSFGAVDAEVTGVPSVLRVSWEPLEGATVRAVFAPVGEEGDALESGAVDGAGDGLLLLGVPHGTEVGYRLVASQGEDAVCSDVHLATTGALPSGFPGVEVAVHEPELVSVQWATISVLLDPESWLTIFDSRGRLLWSWELGWRVTRARLSIDRQAMLLDAMPEGGSPMGIRRIALDGSSVSTTAVPAIGVDWVELPDGGYAALVNEVRELEHEGDTRVIRGQAVVEVEPGGSPRTVWSVFDLHEPDLSVHYEESLNTDDVLAEDWSHINGLTYHQPSDTYIITSQNFHSVIAVQRGTGASLWELGRYSADWTNTSGVELVGSPHGAELLSDDRLLVFNRWSSSYPGSEVAEVALDFDSMEASLAWSATAENNPEVFYLGNAERLPGGNTLVSWSSVGQLDELTPDGTSALRLDLDMSYDFGFVSHLDSLYPE